MEVLDPEEMEDLLAIFWQVPGAWKIDGIIDTSLCLIFILGKLLHFPIQHVGKQVWGVCLVLWLLVGLNRGDVTDSPLWETETALFFSSETFYILKKWGTFKIGTPKQNFSKDAAVFTCVDMFHMRTSGGI